MVNKEFNEDSYKLIYSAEEVNKAINTLAKKIVKDFRNVQTPPTLLIVLNGAIYFGSDLSKALGELNFIHHIDTIKLKRYKEDGHGGSVELLSRPESIDLENKDIIVVEDIADNGDTLNWLNNFLSLREGTPRSVKYALLCLRRRHPTYHFKVHYHCFTVGNDWLVGYGFDSEGLCREWPEIWGKIISK